MCRASTRTPSLPSDCLWKRGVRRVRILGIDPGFGRLGFGVIDVKGNRHTVVEYGCIETEPHMSTGPRLQRIYEGVSGVIRERRPDAMGIEQLFFSRNVTTALVASEARGVVVLAAQIAGVPQFDYTPMQVKQAVAGYGRADKQQVQEMVRVLLGLSVRPKPDDAADALAVALAHAYLGLQRQRIADLAQAHRAPGNSRMC